jgi:hypothetical protein
MAMSPRLLRPRATGFNPKSISGLKLWLDAANTSSLTFNGSTVSQMNDLSGNGFHATQGTANNQPTYQAAGFNGKPTLFLDTNDYLSSAATMGDLFLTPTTSPNFVCVMACYMPTLELSGSVMMSSVPNTDGDRLYFISHFAGSNVIFDTARVSGGRLTVASQSNAGWTTPMILTLYRLGASMGVRMNGATLGSLSNASSTFSSTTATLLIGKTAAGDFNQSYISEMAIYAASLSMSQVSTIERGIGKKWKVAVA